MTEKNLYMCMYPYMHMTKVISLSEAAYAKLKAAKMPGESFSDVALRLTEKQKPLSSFAGCWKMTNKDAYRLKRRLARERKAFKLREARF